MSSATATTSSVTSKSSSLSNSSAKTMTTPIVMPSPTGSASETSDYQRSTPSPRDEPDSGIGSVEDWSSDTSTTGNLHPVAGSARTSEDSASDLGFSEDIKEPLLPPSNAVKKLQRRSTVPSPNNVPIDPRLTLQQVRVALEKIPIENCQQILGAKKASHLELGSKRRNSDSICHANTAVSRSKKAKVSEFTANTKTTSLTSSPSNKNGKITSYMSETKPFTALRKEKLDKILNLNFDSQSNKTETNSHGLTSQQASLDPAHHQNKNDLFLISQLKQLKDASSSTNKSGTSEAADGKMPFGCVHKDSSVTNPAIADLKEDKKEHAIFEAPNPVTQIRFPVTKPPSESITCKWEGCEEVVDSTGKLIDHLRAAHVDIQNTEEKDEDYLYRCMWVGCKVFDKGSSSKGWLQKHITNHGGNKPFQCIVDGCKLRFGTQSLLERHVNSHFKKKAVSGKGVNGSHGDNNEGASSSHQGPQRQNSSSSSSSIVKVMRKTGRKMKVRKTIYSARIFDLFDIGTMAQVQEQLFKIHTVHSRELNMSNDEIHLQGYVGARRMTGHGRKEEVMVLQKWKPDNILPDKWVPLREFCQSQTMKLDTLPHAAKLSILNKLSIRSQGRNHNKRKSKNPENSSNSLS